MGTVHRHSVGRSYDERFDVASCFFWRRRLDDAALSDGVVAPALTGLLWIADAAETMETARSSDSRW
jgi:hypothetical protein